MTSTLMSLTNHESSGKLLVDATQVAMVEQVDKNTKIYFHSGGAVLVTESFQAVRNRMNKALAEPEPVLLTGAPLLSVVEDAPSDESDDAPVEEEDDEDDGPEDSVPVKPVRKVRGKKRSRSKV